MHVTKAMTTPLQGACLPGAETEMSRRYLKMAQQWIPVAMSYFEDWPERPACGHFFGGVHWYGIETAVPLYALAVIGASPEFDERVAGASREEVREVVVKAIRYLCFTHDTGPADCVRPSKGLGMPNTWGTKWGERGRGFFPESQCGGTIANLTKAALILRPHVDDETWMMLATLCADYLDRFGDMAPRSGVYADTQMEENAWTAGGLAASYLFLSGHELAGKWEDSAKRWMYSACSAPQDRFNHGEIEPGMTVSRLTGKTFTTLPDYMAENHGMVHPGYTASGVRSVGSLGVLYRMHGRTEPAQAYWNRQRVYDSIKLLTDLTGSPQPAQGMDRLYLGQNYALHATAHLFLRDPDAGYFERVSLDLAERMQDGNGGRLIDPEIASKCHEMEDPMIIKESEMIAGIVSPYVMHRLMDAGAPPPTPAAEVAKKFNGVRLFPHSGFVFHRHDRGQTSFSWRNYLMALPLTREGTYTVGPSRGTLLAKVQVKDHPASHDVRTLRVGQRDDGAAVLMVNHMAQGAVRQRVLFASLPDGRVLLLERLDALKDCTVERVDQGFLRVLNEHFPKVQGNCRGERTLYFPGGERTFRGFPSADPKDDISLALEHPAWLNVDDRIGLIFRGVGRTIYLNRHHFPPFSFRAVADDLFLSLQEGTRECLKGDRVGELALLFCPEQTHRETPGQALIQADSSSGDAACLITEGCMCAGHFGSRRATCVFPAVWEDAVPVFAGTTRIDGKRVEHAIRMEGEEATLLEQVASVRCDGAVKVEAAAGGGIYAVNEGSHRIQVVVQREGRQQRVDVPAGAAIAV